MTDPISPSPWNTKSRWERMRDNAPTSFELSMAASPPPCTFMPTVLRVYQVMAEPAALPYEALPEREQRVWRLLARAMNDLSEARGVDLDEGMPTEDEMEAAIDRMAKAIEAAMVSSKFVGLPGDFRNLAYAALDSMSAGDGDD